MAAHIRAGLCQGHGNGGAKASVRSRHEGILAVQGKCFKVHRVTLVLFVWALALD
jgi:hypothetical protein